MICGSITDSKSVQDFKQRRRNVFEKTTRVRITKDKTPDAYHKLVDKSSSTVNASSLDDSSALLKGAISQEDSHQEKPKKRTKLFVNNHKVVHLQRDDRSSDQKSRISSNR